MEKGYAVFSPIAHSHSIEVNGMPTVRKGDFWLTQDFAILQHCKALVVLMLPKWEDSVGVAEEIKFAKAHHIPIYFMEYNNMEQQSLGYFDVEAFVDHEDASSAAVLAALDGSLDDFFGDDYFVDDQVDLGELIPTPEDVAMLPRNEINYVH